MLSFHVGSCHELCDNHVCITTSGCSILVYLCDNSFFFFLFFSKQYWGWGVLCHNSYWATLYTYSFILPLHSVLWLGKCVHFLLVFWCILHFCYRYGTVPVMKVLIYITIGLTVLHHMTIFNFHLTNSYSLKYATEYKVFRKTCVMKLVFVYSCLALLTLLKFIEWSVSCVLDGVYPGWRVRLHVVYYFLRLLVDFMNFYLDVLSKAK